MLQLILACAFFLGVHLGISGTSLRYRLIEILGEKLYRQSFSAAALVGLVWLIFAWRSAPYLPLWDSPLTFRYLAVLLMPLAFYLGVAAFTTKNPALTTQVEPPADQLAVGVLRITRHPLMWGIALWAGLHLLANGDWAAILFFGTFLTLAVKGTFDLDQKRLKEHGERWQRYLAVTSNLPFQAILQGRQKLVWKELGWWQIALALGLYAGLLHAHAQLFGAAPLG
ncbi:MAG: NnrU family protein [Methylohalobius sp.]|nr:NnrU family protein [Methylohalobius sp.]